MSPKPPYATVWAAIERQFSAGRALKTLKRIHTSDRPSTTPAYTETARLVTRIMCRIGLEDVETIPFRMDGKSYLFDWLPSPAWTATTAELRVLSPGHLKGVLVRYPRVPTCLAVNSAGTPPGGVRGDLVLEERLRASRAARGKFVLTSSLPSQVRTRYAGTGIRGIISDAVPEGTKRAGRPDDAVTCDPAWHQPWPVPDIVCFTISPGDGKRLREATSKHERVRLLARADAANYSGEVATVTGVVPGRTRGEEVVAMAHLYEPGANDNASGAAVLLEAARCLALGRRPFRTIRIVLPYECFGTLAYLLRRPTAKMIAGLNLDMVGENQSVCASTMEVSLPPESSRDFTGALVQDLFGNLARYSSHLRWRESRFIVDDNAFFSDPLIGCPTPLLLNQPDRFYHSDQDTPDKVDPEALRQIGIVAGTYLGWLANAGASDAGWLAERTLAWSTRRLSSELRAHEFELNRSTTTGHRRRLRIVLADALAFWQEQTQARLDSVGRLLGAADVAAAFKRKAIRIVRRRARTLHLRPASFSVRARPGEIVPLRLGPGIPAMDGREDLKQRIAKATGESFPWSTFLVSALFWADGKKTTGEIALRLQQEFGRGDPKAIRKLFEILADGGYLVLRKAG